MRLTNQQARDMGIEPGPKKPRKSLQDAESARASKKSKEAQITAYCQNRGLPVPYFEYPFHPTRNWRFDMLFSDWLAVEVQGGLFVQGRHSRGAALLDEHEKLNEAVIAGFAVMFCTPQDLETGAIYALVERALKGE